MIVKFIEKSEESGICTTILEKTSQIGELTQQISQDIINLLMVQKRQTKQQNVTEHAKSNSCISDKSDSAVY